ARRSRPFGAPSRSLSRSADGRRSLARMLAPTIVRGLEAIPLDIPLCVPFGIAQGAQVIAENVLVRIELAAGTLGYGDAAPRPAYNGETRDVAFRAIEAARDVVVGADARAWRSVAAALRASRASGSARCAIETALLDALTKRASLPLWSFFGG